MGDLGTGDPKFWVRGSYTSSAGGPDPIYFAAEDKHLRKGEPSPNAIHKTLTELANDMCHFGQTVTSVKTLAYIFREPGTKWLYEKPPLPNTTPGKPFPTSSTFNTNLPSLQHPPSAPLQY